MIERTLNRSYEVSDPNPSTYTPDEEFAAIEAKLAEDPDNAQLWMEKGLALAGAELYRESEECYAHAISLEPFNGILYRHMAHRMLSQWRFEDARAGFTIASRLIPDNWDVWYHLGLSYYLLREYDLAQAAYKRCLELTDMTDIEAFPAVIDWSWRTARRRGDEAYATELLAMLPADFEVGTDECGYALNCAVYQGRATVDEVLAMCADKDPLNAATNSYAMANYLRETGEEARGVEELGKLMESLDAEGWCTFGYLAAMVDLKG